MMKSKIHRAIVTGADLNYEGSIAIDQQLIDAAGLLPGEAVHVWNVSSGGRLETYVIPGKRGSGTICLNGAAARMVQPGDPVIIASFCWIEEEKARQFQGKVVLVDERNKAVKSRQQTVVSGQRQVGGSAGYNPLELSSRAKRRTCSSPQDADPSLYSG